MIRRVVVICALVAAPFSAAAQEAVAKDEIVLKVTKAQANAIAQALGVPFALEFYRQVMTQQQEQGVGRKGLPPEAAIEQQRTTEDAGRPAEGTPAALERAKK